MLVFVSLYLLLSSVGFSLASPAYGPSTNFTSTSLGTISDPNQSTCNDVHYCRTMSSLIWSCISTILACIWTAVHRNIAGPKQGRVSRILEHGKIIVVGLLVPEWVLAWAIRQFLNARNLGRRLEQVRTEAQSIWGEKKKALLGESRNGSGESQGGMSESQGDVRKSHGKDLSEKEKDGPDGAGCQGSTFRADGRRSSTLEESDEKRLILSQDNNITRHIQRCRSAGKLSDLVIESENGRLETEWSIVHGFFVIMGDFHAYKDGKPLYPLSTDDVIEHVKNGSLVPPTRKEIEGMAQGDWFSKFIAITQLVWFVAQCVARYIEKLPTSQLEIMTLAYTSITVFMYGFWWLKPRNITCPIRVAVVEPPQREPDERWTLFGASRVIWTLAGWQDLLMSREMVWESRRHIPAFYGGTVSTGRSVELADCTSDVIGLVVTVLFGAIHCLAWSAAFPSVKQRFLWRICALAVMITPPSLFLSMLSWLVFKHIDEKREVAFNLKLIRWPIEGVLMLASAISFITYVVARTILLVLAFSTLAYLPVEVYRTVSWTIHIPHII